MFEFNYKYFMFYLLQYIICLGYHFYYDNNKNVHHKYNNCVIIQCLI